MNSKLLFLDIDGTLTPPGRNDPPESAMEAIRAAQKAGHRGNCDMRSSLSSALICTVGGVCVFATHGHLYNVRYEPALDTLAAAAQDTGATVALFGHTHHACLEKQQGITLLNPGTIGRVSRPSYAVLSVAEGSCEAELKTLTQL